MFTTYTFITACMIVKDITLVSLIIVQQILLAFLKLSILHALFDSK